MCDPASLLGKAVADACQTWDNDEELNGKSPCNAIRDGFYFLPLVGVSWIPFSPLAKQAVLLGKEIRLANEKLAPKFSGKTTFDQFNQYVAHITDYSWATGGVVEACQAAEFFEHLAEDSTVDASAKHAFFNLFPLAISANYAPGADALADDAPGDIIDIKETHDQGMGEYRGYLHFVPWVHIKNGEVFESGILKSEEFRQNMTEDETRSAGKQVYDLAVPTTSSSITIIPEWNVLEPGPGESYNDWEDAIGGYLLFLKYGKSWTHAFEAGWEGLPVIINEHVVPGKQEKDGREMDASGREVKFEMGQPYPDWYPKSKPEGTTEARAELRHGGRIAKEGQEMAQKLNGRDVPWICLAIQSTLDSDGNVTLNLGGSLFPCHAIYGAIRYSSFFGFAPDSKDSMVQLCYEEKRSAMETAVGKMRWGKLVHCFSKTALDAVHFTEREFGADVVERYWVDRLAEDPGGGMFPKSTHHEGRKEARSQGTPLESFGKLETITYMLGAEIVIKSTRRKRR